MRNIIALVIISLIPVSSLAAPTISGVSGIIGFGQTISISGTEFGTHSLQVESLQQNIESGSTGNLVVKSGWDHSEWADFGPEPVYAVDQFHSGAKSYKCDFSPVRSDPANYECVLNYDLPNTVGYNGTLYISYWVRYSGYSAGDFQWKMLRIGETSTVVDNYPQLLLSNWASQDYIAHNAGGANIWLGANNNPQFDGSWSRVELIVVGNSNGATNGTVNLTRYTDTGTIYTFNSSAIGDLSPSHPTWESVMLQNYLGNGTISGNNAAIWIDDVYIQTGTQSRVELCAGSTWANRGKCEIQVPTSWGSTSISATANTGNFSGSSTAYIYVVDANGDSNTSGYAVEIGGGSISGGSPINTGSTMRLGSGSTRIYPVQ